MMILFTWRDVPALLLHALLNAFGGGAVVAMTYRAVQRLAQRAGRPIMSLYSDAYTCIAFGVGLVGGAGAVRLGAPAWVVALVGVAYCALGLYTRGVIRRRYGL